MSRYKTNAEKSASATKTGFQKTVVKIYPKSVAEKKSHIVEGRKKNYSVGSFRFVPLMNPLRFDPETGDLVELGTKTFYKYAFKTGGADAKPKTVKWEDTGLSAADGYAISDPGILLGLSEPKDSRVENLGLGYKDNHPRDVEFYLPVIWGVEKTDTNAVDMETGQVALLVLTPFQYSNFVSALESGASDNERVMVINPDRSIDEYDYEDNLGFSWTFSINTSLSMREMYSFSISAPASQSLLEDNLEAAQKMLEEHHETWLKFQKGYQPFIDSNMKDELSDEDADYEIGAWVARNLLEAWGHEMPESMDARTVWDNFLQIVPKYNLTASMQLGQAMGEPEILRPNRPSVTNEDTTKDDVGLDNLTEKELPF